MTAPTREEIDEYCRRALTQPLYSSGGECSELPELMANALRALAAERDALQSFAQEQACNAEINRLRVDTLERGDEIMKIRAACADAISQAEAERDALQRERDEIAQDWETSNSLRAQLKAAIAERDYSVQMLSLTRQSIAAYQAGKLEAERDALRKERDEARRDAEWKVSRLMEADNAIKQSMAETAAALAQVAALREGLAFYANPEIYKPHPHGPAFERRDLSFKASAALSAPEGEKGE